MKNIKSVNWLREHLYDENLVIVDCRFTLGSPNAGANEYKESHIPNAVYLDLEQDLSGPKGKHGGRHPIPNLESLLETIESAGINENTTVIAYDDGTCAMAARLWFLLKYIGHKNVYILDGGYKEWVANGQDVTEILPEPHRVTYQPELKEHLIVDMNAVKKLVNEPVDTVLVDARAHERYKGEVEPIDRAAGHIPTARNYFFQENFQHGKWKTKEELMKLYEELQGFDVISYCGSGVTACVNIIGMDEADIFSKLYVGSWSDWSSYPENDIEK